MLSAQHLGTPVTLLTSCSLKRILTTAYPGSPAHMEPVPITRPQLGGLPTVAYGHWAPAPLLCIQTNFAVGMGGCIGPNGCAVLYRTSSNPKRATRNRICITTHRPPFLFERAIAWTSDSKGAFNQAGEKNHGNEFAGYTAAKAVSIDSKLVLVTTR